MMGRARCVGVTALITIAIASAARADDLANQAFTIQYDAQGIRSLKRTNDIHDTDYIQANGALGRLLIRFRTTASGDWRELREMLLQPPTDGRSIRYRMGVLPPALAARSSPSAAVGVAGLRGLNDGQVPVVAPGGGRGGGRGAAPAAAANVPIFTWSGARGPTQWVQYTFPDREEVSRADVFWVASAGSAAAPAATTPPDSWRILYQEDGQWKPVTAKGPYGVEPNAFNAVDFAPVKTMALRIEISLAKDATVGLAEWRVGAAPALVPSPDLKVEQTFRLDGDALEWTVSLANDGSRTVEIGDLAVPLNFAERAGARGDIYTKKLLRHSFVAGHGSWVYWQRSNGAGPYLVMTPVGQTKFEYQESSGAYTPYVHAKLAVAAARAAGGNWRLPVTNLVLTPKGSAGGIRTYTFRFQWAPDFAGVRNVLHAEGKFDTSVVPGMVVPVDLPALFSLRTKNAIQAIEPEHPAATRIEPVPTRAADTRVYRARFTRLGENMLRIKYGDGRWTTLEFFVTEPLETVIAKRAAFLAGTHQHTRTDKWYAGVYSDWDQKNEILRSPEDRDGLSAWLTDANDDAGNARPAFLASKNVFLPNQAEIESLELYISKYLWGGMQMTDREKYPYAIYGIPNFRANRESADPGRNGQSHVWRIYDYPHIVMLYHRMYEIAKFYPDKIRHLDAATYLERAYRTAVAYWTVPIAVEKWSADAVGTMNEAFIPELIDTLEREGKPEWARTLRGHWEGKVDRFVNRTPNLYGSEFAFDSTGFESTGAFAKYAVAHAGATAVGDSTATEFSRRVSRESAQKFMDFQLLLNMSDRGWLETTYGYWFPGKANDGAAGGGFMPDAIGRAWIGKEMPRGAWHYSAEEDVGYAGALRSNATIVARDSVFGEIAYGGLLTRDGRRVKVVPRDGLRVRFHVIRDAQRVHVLRERDGFARDVPIVVSDDLSRIELTLEDRAARAHETMLTVAGLPAGRYDISAAGRQVATMDGATESRVAVPVNGATPVVVQRRARD